jgi:precorrin-6B methylase 2
MRYLDETVWGSITPKWLGSYEAELHPIIARIVEHSYNTIIDVGCAEGYYAVGLARAIAGAKIYAFDIDFISRAQIRRLATLNNVRDRLQIHAACNHSDLDTLSRGETLVVCDTEGFEAQLLNPDIALSLRHDDILVEVHETSDSSSQVDHLLRSRFAESHRIERVVATNRDSWMEQNGRDFSPTISQEDLREATEENRTAGWVWLWMEAKTKKG